MNDFLFPESLPTHTYPHFAPKSPQNAPQRVYGHVATTFGDDFLLLLPLPIGTFAEFRTRTHGVEQSGPQIYAVYESIGGRPIYIGTTHEEIAERLRKHASKRKPRNDIGRFSSGLSRIMLHKYRQ